MGQVTLNSDQTVRYLPRRFYAGDDWFTYTARDVGGAVQTARVTVHVRASEQGWTDFSESPDTRKVYVSSSDGNDLNDGLSEATPKATLREGYALMRDGFPDWLLIKRGDVLQQAFPRWSKSGRSPQERMLIGAYGTSIERPRIVVPTDYFGLEIRASSSSHLAITSVFIEGTRNASNQNSGTGIIVASPRGNDLLIENCRIESFGAGINIQNSSGSSDLSDVRVRRNVIAHNFSAPFGGLGVVVDNTRDLLIEENLLDYNGWFPGVAGASANGNNISIGRYTSNAVVRRNISSRAGGAGVYILSAGIVEDNVTSRVSYGVSAASGGVIIRNNILLEQRDISREAGHGFGITIFPPDSALPTLPTVIDGNIISKKLNEPFTPFTAISTFSNPPGRYTQVDIRNNIVRNFEGYAHLTIEPNTDHGTDRFNVVNNIFAEASNRVLVTYTVPTATVGAVTFSGNSYAAGAAGGDNWFILNYAYASFDRWQQAVEPNASRQPIAFRDPDRDITSYHASIGGTGNYDQFMDTARTISRDNWLPQYTAEALLTYVRQGYEH